MNPLNFTGPEFLQFYILHFLMVMAIAALLRWYLRLPGGEPSKQQLDLWRYEPAYLAGGKNLAINAAIARLVKVGYLAVDATERKLTRKTRTLPNDAPQLERSIVKTVDAGLGETIKNVRLKCQGALGSIEKRLRELELIVSQSQAQAAFLVPLLVALSAPMLGLAKIFVGISRGKPVVFLVILCCISLPIIGASFGRAVLRSRRGDRALELLKLDNAALRYTTDRGTDTLAGDDLVLGIGLFGIGILSGGALADLRKALTPPPNASGAGGCGSGSCGGGGGCGGGGCGGGCGGCGG